MAKRFFSPSTRECRCHQIFVCCAFAGFMLDHQLVYCICVSNGSPGSKARTPGSQTTAIARARPSMVKEKLALFGVQCNPPQACVITMDKIPSRKTILPK